MENDKESSDDRQEENPAEGASPGKVESKEVEGLASALGKLQKKEPETVREILAMFASRPMVNPLVGKMTGQHISSMLTIVGDHDQREYDLRERDATQRSHDRFWSFGAFAGIVGLVIFVLNRFADQPDVLIPILTGLGGLASGGVGGYGLGKRSAL